MHTPFFKVPTVVVKTGHELAAEVKKGLSPTQAALLARDLVTGDVFYCDPTPKQACGFTGASSGYLHTLLRASAEEVEQIRQGTLSLSGLHNKPTAFAAVARATNEVYAEIGDEDIDVGTLVDRVLAKIDRTSLHDALDRLIAPPATSTVVKTNGNAGYGHDNDNDEPGAETRKPPITLADVVSWGLTASEAEHAAVVCGVGVGSAWDANQVYLD